MIKVPRQTKVFKTIYLPRLNLMPALIAHQNLTQVAGISTTVHRIRKDFKQFSLLIIRNTPKRQESKTS